MEGPERLRRWFQTVAYGSGLGGKKVNMSQMDTYLLEMVSFQIIKEVRSAAGCHRQHRSYCTQAPGKGGDERVNGIKNKRVILLAHLLPCSKSGHGGGL